MGRIMAEDRNPDNYPDRFVRVRGRCGCDEPSHYITLDRGPVSLKAPLALVQLEQKKNRRYDDKPEQAPTPSAPCRFSSPPPAPVLPSSLPVLPSSPPAQLTSPPLVPYRVKPLALFHRFTISEPAQFHFASPSLTRSPPRWLPNPLPSPQASPLTKFWLVTNRSTATSHRVTITSAASPRLSSPPPTPPPPKRHRNKTEKSDRKRKKNKRADKLTKQHHVHEESGLQANAGLHAAVPVAADDLRSTRARVVDADNARLAAAIRAQLAMPVPVLGPAAAVDGDGGGGDAWRPRHQPKTLAGARLAAALAERRRAKLLIGLQHLGIP